MRFTTIFHFLDFEQSISYSVLTRYIEVYIVVKNKFTILYFDKDLNIDLIKNILVIIINLQMSFKFTLTNLFWLYEVYCY